MQPKRHLPTRLHEFLTDLEATNHSRDVWELITALGRAVDLPYIDVISASDFRDWSRTLFIRTSYDASWLHTYNQDPELFQWSYFRSYCAQHLTPIAVGFEFLDEYHDLPPGRVAVLQ